jgi:dTDP-4-dehydrorhamnose reductase
MRIAVTGAAGQLGWELVRELSALGDVTALSREALDITDGAAIARSLESLRPDVVVNAAAYTAVDRAESEVELCYSVNAQAPGALARASRRVGALFVHYSTDYVFDGSRETPYMEDDATAPLNVYGASKLAGEKAVQAAGGRWLVLRTSWVYGARGRNFLGTVRRLVAEGAPLRIVNDQVGAPTSSDSIAGATRRIISQALDAPDEGDATWGVYHLTARGSTTWFDFALRILQADHSAGARRDAPEVVPVQTADYPTAARRPRYSVLDNKKIARRFGVELPDWEELLDRVIASGAA